MPDPLTVALLAEKSTRGLRGLRGPPGKASVVPGPKGDPGDKGDPGEDGSDGDSIKGEKGEKGKKGDPGRDGIGPDEHVALDALDPRPGYLTDKLQAGVGIEFARRTVKGSDRLVIHAMAPTVSSGDGGGSGHVLAGGSAHPTLAGHDTMGLATDAELAAHAATLHDAAIPTFIQDTDPALPSPQKYLWVDTNTDFLWYNDGQVG